MSTRRSRNLGGTFLKAAAAAIALVGALILATDRIALAETPRDLGAEQFVQTQGQRAVTLLVDRSLSDQEKIRAFRALVENITDVPRIMYFVLGKYGRTITPAQMRRFAPVFREYEQQVYQHQLSGFQGDTLKVTNSLVRKPGDVVVETTISGGDSPPGEVFWRVLASGSGWKVVDLEVAGVWLGITQQQDFVSTIDNHGGDIDALITQLEKQTQVRPGSPVGR